MNKPKFPNSKQVSIAIVLVCISLIAGALIAQALTPSTTFWISPGIYPLADYTIWKEASTYYAKNIYGEMQYSSLNGADVLQDTIDALNDTGGRIKILCTYLNLASNTIHIPYIPSYYNINIEGNGLETTTIGYNGTSYAFEIGDINNQHRGHKLKDFTLSQAGTPFTGTGIYCINSYYDVFENLRITDFNVSIHLNGGYDLTLRPDTFSAFTTIRNVLCVRDFITLLTQNHPTISYLENFASADEAVVSGSSFIKVITDTETNFFGNNLYTENKDVAFDLDCQDTLLQNIWFHHEINTWIQLSSTCRDIKIHNVFGGTPSTTYVNVIGTIYRCQVTGLYDSNLGNQSDNEGTATILDGQTSVTVTHRLCSNAEPARIFVSGTTAQTSSCWVSTFGATTLVISVSSPVTGDQIVYWKGSCYIWN